MKMIFNKDQLRKRTWKTDFTCNANPIHWVAEEELKKKFPDAITAIYSDVDEPDFFRLMIQFSNDADEAQFILLGGIFDDDKIYAS